MIKKNMLKKSLLSLSFLLLLGCEKIALIENEPPLKTAEKKIPRPVSGKKAIIETETKINQKKKSNLVSQKNPKKELVAQASMNPVESFDLARNQDPSVIKKRKRPRRKSVTFDLEVFNQVKQAMEADSEKYEDENFLEILKKVSRKERGAICEKIMRESVFPKAQYFAADCLLFNAYGEKAIPTFVDFMITDKNKKYLNGRMGYEWKRGGDRYKIGPDAWEEMLGGKDDLSEWVLLQINHYIVDHIEDYPSQDLEQIISRIWVQDPPQVDVDLAAAKNCVKWEVNFKGYICERGRTNGKLKNCIKKQSDQAVWTCKERKTHFSVPDPGDTGKETIEGIDSDQDGVRDDVQREIEKMYSIGSREYIALKKYAQALQKSLIAEKNGDLQGLQEGQNDINKATDCKIFVFQGTDELQTLPFLIKSITLNTPERSDSYNNFAYGFDGMDLFSEMTLNNDFESACEP